MFVAFFLVLVLPKYVSSIFLLQSMIYHKRQKCHLCVVDVSFQMSNTSKINVLLIDFSSLDYSLRYLLPMMKNSASEDVTNPPTVVKVSNNEDLNGLDVLFAILDNESERLGIANYTLECTTLEQIFLEMERQAVVDPGVQKLMAKVGMKEQNYGMFF